MKKITLILFTFFIGFLHSQIMVNGVNWSKTDLNSRKFQNGDEIFIAKTIEEWKTKCTKKEPCAFEIFDSSESRLVYNCYALDDTRKIAPKGTRIATKKDWVTLVNSFGGELSSSNSLKDPKKWNLDNNKSNLSGLNIAPGFIILGNVLILNTNFLGDTIRDNTQYWCHDNSKENFNTSISISESNNISFNNINKECGFYVRYIFENENTEMNNISLVKIGYNFWQNQNCRITKYMNGDPIRFVSNSKELDEANKRQEGAYCFVNFEYKNESDSNYIIYNWYAIIDPRGFGTNDLRIPNWSDWKDLISSLNKDGKTENDLKKIEKWPENKKYKTSNYYGFNGTPTFFGQWDLYYQRVNFQRENSLIFWVPDLDVGSYTKLDKDKAYQAYFANDGYKLFYNQQNKNHMFPVRLVKGTTSYFDGDVISGLKQGKGVLYVRKDENLKYDDINFINVQEGSKIEGNWINNKIEGKAYITWSDGTKVEALFKDNYHQGEFTLRNNSTQKCIYDGKTFNSHFKKSENEIENEKTTTKSISINSYKIELYCSSSCEAKAKAEIMARERERENQSQSQNSNNSNSTSGKSDMHVYVCNDCGKIQTSKSSPFDKSTCSEIRWGGIGGSSNGRANGDHDYQDMGNSGSQQFVCNGCHISILLFEAPTNSGSCGARGSNCCNHQWQKH